MPIAPMSPLLRYFYRLVARRGDGQADRVLLQSYLESRDEGAFAAIVERYGSMVFGVCRAVLRNRQDAEDAFQATFLALSRKPQAIRRGDSLGSWLHGVAYRVACNALAARLRRREVEANVAPPAPPRATDDLSWAEVKGVLHAELAALPARFRQPLVLCYLEGLTQEEAARRLGWTATTLRGRLYRGRDLLGRRLERRGLGLAAALGTTALAGQTWASPVPWSLTEATLKTAIGGAGACATSSVALLAQGAIAPVLPFKYVAIVGLALAGAVVGGHLVALQHDSFRTPAAAELPNTLASTPQPPASEKKPTALTDFFGDPLPKDSRMRIGTERFRTGGLVNTCAYSPDGKMLAAGSDDFSIRLFDARTGRPLRLLRSGFQEITQVAFSPDGQMLACIGASETIELFETSSGKLLRTMGKPTGAVRGVWSLLAFSPDGKQLVAGSNRDGEQLQAGRGASIATLWDVDTGKELHRFEGYRGQLRSLALSPDGLYLATGSGDMTVRLWELATGKQMREFPVKKKGGLEGPGAKQPVVFSPDSKWLASEDRQAGGVCIWETATGKEVCRIPPKSDCSLLTLAFTPDGKSIAAGSFNHQLFFWEVPSGKLLQERAGRPWTVSGGNHPGGIICLAYSPDGKTLAFGEDNCLTLWDVLAGKEIEYPDGPTARIDSVAFVAGGKTLVTQMSANPRQSLLEWDLMAGRVRWRLHDSFPDACAPSSKFAFATDGKALSGCDGQMLWLWDRAAGKEIRRLELVSRDKQLVWSTSAWSPDGKLFAIAGDSFGDGSFPVFDAAAGKEVCRIAARAQHLKWLAFSPDNRFLAFSENDGGIHLHDLPSGKKIGQIDVPFFQRMVFSPNSKVLASIGHGINDGKRTISPLGLNLWDMPSGKLIRHIDVTNPMIRWETCIPAFSHDGLLIACGASDGSVQIWETATGNKRREFRGHSGAVSTVAFAPDGRTLATGSEDCTVLLWDLARPAELSKQAASLAVLELEAFWSDLASDDGTKVDVAIWSLAQAPRQAVPFLRKQLEPRSADPRVLAKLIAELNSNEFAVRQQASKALDDLGEAAEIAIRKALADNPALELRQRLEQILQKRDREVVLKLRAIEAMEHCASAEAREVLQMLVETTPNPRIRQAAVDALKAVE
jgi:RNA polymerase sigma factor (sigma-70 family)